MFPEATQQVRGWARTPAMEGRGVLQGYSSGAQLSVSGVPWLVGVGR